MDKSEGDGALERVLEVQEDPSTLEGAQASTPTEETIHAKPSPPDTEASVHQTAPAEPAPPPEPSVDLDPVELPPPPDPSEVPSLMLTPEEIAARAGEVVTVPVEQWQSMQQQLEEMEHRQRELLATLGSVTEHSTKTITGLQDRVRGLEEQQLASASRPSSPLRMSSPHPLVRREASG